MSGAGRPSLQLVDARGLSVAVVTATWNAEICDQLHRRAVETAQQCGAQVSEYRVVGALELGVVVQELASAHDAVVALGCVIKGGTPHFDYVCDSVTSALTRIALDTRTPIGNGVLTTLTQEQAVERAGGEGATEDKGAESMVAALHTALQLSAIRAAKD
ncbi:6,7-dimethyl-8-ribityllumazine synthase [Corynebacterium epidermidicanis]|uniref:6,7-dimethyl-8-ribityllumazine synthase n=1 Tax=Corynebacterium epidermidicanis TaxID=1050174 RepID=A0A0G3GUM2_9CORY|nr:6,7-dimethyl-8-ribityllumazine synthase [Corynebacterium epidermidicanis]AKK03218.1 6,7-dimethyl-8-ribityllumazine synthase [Corynebacterium epidermidicanis]